MIFKYDAKGCTKDAIQIYKENKNRIGEICKATMTIKDESILSLYDKEENELRIISGLDSGYGGEGPHGLLWVLRDAGFIVREQFVFEQNVFTIKK